MFTGSASLMKYPRPYIVLVLVLSGLLFVASYLWGSHLEAYKRNLTGLDQREAVLEASSSLSQELEYIYTSFSYLQNSPVFESYLNEQSETKRELVQQTWSAYMRAYDVINQIRWLDTRGRELIRIDFDTDYPKVTALSDLQDKSDRYYFRVANDLADGAVYLSPLDLNIEHGAIEVPYKPMFRLAAKLKNRNGTVQGILVINYHARPLLERVADKARKGVALQLLNQEGYWLLAANPLDEWGQMFANDKRLPSRAEEVWQAMEGQLSGQQAWNDGVWTWRQVSPIRSAYEGNTGRTGTKSQVKIHGAERFWVVASFVPEAMLAEAARSQWLLVTMISAVLWALVLLFTYSLAYYHRHILYLNKEVSRQEQRAVDAMHTKERFLANISHEVRAPLTAITGFSRLLADDPQLSRYHREVLGIILSSSKTLLDLINDILSLARGSAPVEKVNLQRFNLRALLDDISLEIGLLLDPKQVTLKLDVAADLPPLVITDMTKLRQILINLLVNATKYTANGSIVLKVVWSSQNEQACELHLEVRDTGKGISPVFQERVFEAFEQEQEQGEGVGLGLAICKHHVDQLGGTIRFHSEPGVGSCFYVDLPVSCGDGSLTESPTRGVNPEHLAAVRQLPDQLRDELQTAAEQGDRGYSAQVIAQIASVDKSLAQSLEQYVERFDYNQLIRLLRAAQLDREQTR